MRFLKNVLIVFLVVIFLELFPFLVKAQLWQSNFTVCADSVSINKIIVGTYQVSFYWSWNTFVPPGTPISTSLCPSQFHIQVDDNYDFSSPILNTTTNSPNNPYTVTLNLAPNTTYYWRIRIYTNVGVSPSNYYVWSNWAQGPSFTRPNELPSATNLKANLINGCIGNYYTFSWTFTDPDGDSQSAYQIQIDNNSNFSSPEIDTGKIISSSNYYTNSTPLSYNTTFYWRLKVWDSKNASSDWIIAPSFTTPKHPYPFVDFEWSPQNPTVNEEVQFIDKSEVYGGATKVSWYWTFQDGSPPNSRLQNPVAKFLSPGPKSVTLEVTDSDGYSCTKQKIINLRLPLPKWKEIQPY